MTPASSDPPVVALLCGGRTSMGGQPLAAARLLNLLSPEVRLLPCWLTRPSKRPKTKTADGGLIFTPPGEDLQFTFESSNWLRCRLEEIPKVAAFHLHGVFECPTACLGSKLPVIASFRGSDLNFGVYRKAQELGLVFARASVCTVMNEQQETLARRLFEIPGPIFRVPNSFVPRKVQPDPLAGMPRPVIASVAEFRRVTGLDTLVEAFLRLGTGSLLLIGPFHPVDSPHYSSLLDRIPRVHRTGSCSQQRVLELLAGSDVAVFPGVSEGMPNKVLEAMSVPTPVVVSDVAGNTQLIDDGVHGRHFRARRAEHLSGVLREVLSTPAGVTRAWTERALARLRESFRPEDEKRAWLECYRAAGLLRT